MRQLSAALAIAAALVSSAPARSGGFGHLGQADPAGEGFSKLVQGTEPAPSPGNDGLDYWEIDSSDLATNAFFYTRGNQFDAGFIDLVESPGGWLIRATLRVLEVTGGGADGGDSWQFGEANSTPGGSRSRWAELSFTPVPEPGRAVLLLAGGAPLVLVGLRRLRRAS